MASNDMAKALQHPHPEAPFSHIGDDTITALTQLAEIFKNQSRRNLLIRLPRLAKKKYLPL
jgi:hypothetical protein